MYDFIIQISLAASLGLMIYLLSRAVPRLSETAPRQANAFDRLLGKLPLDQVDSALSSSFERILRKTKIVLMKADNFINGHLTKMKEHAEHSREKQVDLKEKMEALTIDSVKPKDDNSQS